MKNKRYVRNKRRNMKKQKSILFTAFLILAINILFTANTLVVHAKENSKPLYKYYESYMVDKGDTLLSIAYDMNIEGCSSKKIQECVDEMIEINSLDHSGTICYGNYIIVPYYSDEYR